MFSAVFEINKLEENSTTTTVELYDYPKNRQRVEHHAHNDTHVDILFMDRVSVGLMFGVI